MQGGRKGRPYHDTTLTEVISNLDIKKYRHPIMFELSSAHDVVRWGWMRRNSMRVIFFARPASSAQEYERQMQRLLSLIAAKTGLPLYDLR